MSHSDITIVITAFKSDEKIYSCLNSINPSLNVLIVENSDNRDFKDKIEKKYANVVCILAGENLGYAKGNNLGLSKVKTKYALILNPDAVLQKDAIDNFFYTVKKYPNFAIIGPAIQEEKNLKNDLLTSSKDLIEVENVKGFAMFLNISQFDEINFFDKNFFIYFEEIDLCRRLRQKNKKIYLDPKIVIKHIGGSSHNESINYEMELSRNWHWMWSTFYFNKKHYGYMTALFKILPKFLSAMFKTIFYKVTSNNEKKDIYYCRFNGILNSILMRKSWYRPKIN
jgi:GT2 family glycosyltransferase